MIRQQAGKQIADKVAAEGGQLDGVRPLQEGGV